MQGDPVLPFWLWIGSDRRALVFCCGSLPIVSYPSSSVAYLLSALRSRTRRARTSLSWLPHSSRSRSSVMLLALWVGMALVPGCGRKSGSFSLGPDQDGDGWPRDLDCDDEDASVFPGADELLDDRIDQDCSGSAARGMGGDPYSEPVASGGGDDESKGAGGRPGSGGMGGEGTILADADSDGFAAAPEGDDCDDTRGEVFPGSIEVVLNGIDENCDGSDLAGTLEATDFLSVDAVVGEAPDMVVVAIQGEPHLLVAWADSRVDVRQDVYGQILDLSGKRIGPEFPIDVVDNHAKSGLRLASRGDGVLAVWATSEGVFAQQLEPDGSLRGIRFGLADPGASLPIPAFGAQDSPEGGAWAVAWNVPSAAPGGQAQMRALSTDVEAIRAPIESLGGAESVVSHVTLVGNPAGFLASWVADGDDAARLLAQERSRNGAALRKEFSVYDGFVVDPVLIRSEETYAAVFRTGASFGHAAAKIFEVGNSAGNGEVLRLSAESIAQTGFRAVNVPSGWLILWNDDRHLDHQPGIQAIYGNVVNQDDVNGPFSRAFYADTAATLGGIASHESDVFAVFKRGSRARLLKIEQF